jgi:hypothetical protein
VLRYTVRTVAADLRRGGHIPKMQNNIGRRSMLRVLRQLRSKDGGGWGGAGCRTVPCRATPRSAWRCVLHNCRRFTLDRLLRQQQKHHVLRTSFLRIYILLLYQLRHTYTCIMKRTALIRSFSPIYR